MSAYAGAVGLALGVLGIGTELEARLPFDSPVFAGIALALIVGLPFTLVAAAAWRGDGRTEFFAVVAGALVVGWIVVQYVFIREFSFFQPLYLVVGVAYLVVGRRELTRLLPP